jgi:hypothetical protein
MCRVDQDNPMQMVGHDDPLIEIDLLPDGAGLQPFFGNDLAAFIQLHCAVDDLAK